MPYFVPTLHHKPSHLVAARQGGKMLYKAKKSIRQQFIVLCSEVSAATVNRRVASSGNSY